MEPRMLDKINSLKLTRKQKEQSQEDIKATIREILDEIKEIAEDAEIPGYMLVDLGNKLQT